MSANVKTEEENHAKANAQGWLESIQEMVGNLERESAAELFASDLSAEQCIKILEAESYEIDQVEVIDCETSLNALREMVAEVAADEATDIDGFEFDEETARETLEQSVLSVEVRSDWYTPGSSEDDRKPCEFNILLTSGGPALRLIGELDEYGQPTRAWLEYQDWGTPWTHYYVEGAGDVLVKFASCFYFGE